MNVALKFKIEFFLISSNFGLGLGQFRPFKIFAQLLVILHRQNESLSQDKNINMQINFFLMASFFLLNFAILYFLVFDKKTLLNNFLKKQQSSEKVIGHQFVVEN